MTETSQSDAADGGGTQTQVVRKRKVRRTAPAKPQSTPGRKVSLVAGIVLIVAALVVLTITLTSDDSPKPGKIEERKPVKITRVPKTP